jgi:hypothetical protein
MAIQRRHQRPGDLEFNAAAQAAAVDGGHWRCPRLLTKAFNLGGEEGFCHALTQTVIAGLDPAIHAADKSVWTTGSSPVVTNCRVGWAQRSPARWIARKAWYGAMRLCLSTLRSLFD